MKLTKRQIKEALSAYRRGHKAYTLDSPKAQHESIKKAWRQANQA